MNSPVATRVRNHDAIPEFWLAMDLIQPVAGRHLNHAIDNVIRQKGKR
jgi:hypothetical protein